MARDALRPEQHVAVGAGEPEAVLPQTQQHRVVDDAAGIVGEQHVAAFAHAAFRQIPRREQFRELQAVAARDLDVALDGHVPQRHVGEQAPVLRLERRIADRQQHVVVDGVAAAPGALRRLEIGRASETGSTLDQGRIEYHLVMMPETKPAFTLDLDLKVGKYDIQKMLGKGATGTVYLAKDTFTGKEVALKTIEPEVFRDPEF